MSLGRRVLCRPHALSVARWQWAQRAGGTAEAAPFCLCSEAGPLSWAASGLLALLSLARLVPLLRVASIDAHVVARSARPRTLGAAVEPAATTG
jgi:hypothetical protein